MELIYANRTHKDMGVIEGYNFDLAYGTSENNFSLSLPLNAHCCEDGFFVYIEGTEYGGIIDTIKVDTSKETVTYCGRTWHGILANAIIQPPKNYDYKVVNGEANEIIQELIEEAGLESLFYAKDEESEFEIGGYQFYRYVDLYNGLLMMLSSNNAKLKMTHIDNKVMLEAVPLIDYTEDEEWNSTQLDFKIERAFHPCNHLICLGSGNLAKRHVIHLFTDENGGVQDYAKSDNPVEDADYILDESKQIITGIDEVCQVYDNSGAQTAENYVLLTSQPRKWYKVFGNYFIQTVDEDGFVHYEEATESERTEEGYRKLTTQPSNWTKHYMDYFFKKSGEFYNVEAVVIPAVMKYKELTKKPSDWDKKYSNYYYYFTDGYREEYRKVSGVTYYKFKKQTLKPSDWDKNYFNYFQVKKGGGFENVPKKSDIEKAPKWKKKKYYTRYSCSKAPDFKKTKSQGIKYYIYKVTEKEKHRAPEFVVNKYYEYYDTTEIVKPAWLDGTYYRKTYDNYAELVEGGLKKLEELWSVDKLDASLDGTSYAYDVGDIVGATDETTGINVVRAVSKKIVTIESGLLSIKYKLGG